MKIWSYEKRVFLLVAWGNIYYFPNYFRKIDMKSSNLLANFLKSSRLLGNILYTAVRILHLERETAHDRRTNIHEHATSQKLLGIFSLWHHLTHSLFAIKMLLSEIFITFADIKFSIIWWLNKIFRYWTLKNTSTLAAFCDKIENVIVILQ